MRIARHLCLLTLILLATEAGAAVEPSATRIAIPGQTRIYRTFGWAADPELYAPLTQELTALGLTVMWLPGEEQVTLQFGANEARWRVTRNLGELNGGSGRGAGAPVPLAFETEGLLFLPVRASAALMGGGATWSSARRTLELRLDGTAAKGRGVMTPSVAVPAAGPGAVVTRLQWSESAGGLALDVEATAPVHASVLQLQNPNRLVIDFRPATFELESALEPRGAVRSARVGQFQPGIARLVLELSGARLTGTGLPRVPQNRFTIRLTAGTTTAAAPRPAVRGGGARRPRQLASRGGLTIRDPESLRAALAAGEGLLAGKVICIDAGHGGRDPGARGAGGLWEKDLTLQMALEAARALEAAGANVIMTRSGDVYRSLDERYDLANARRVDLFISIHCNSMPRANMASGTQTYYCHGASLALAEAMHPHIVDAMGGSDRGIHSRRFAVVRHTEMPAVLLEVGYINHSDDAQKLSDPQYQRTIGEAICMGLIRYFGG